MPVALMLLFAFLLSPLSIFVDSGLVTDCEMQAWQPAVYLPSAGYFAVSALEQLESQYAYPDSLGDGLATDHDFEMASAERQFEVWDVRDIVHREWRTGLASCDDVARKANQRLERHDVVTAVCE